MGQEQPSFCDVEHLSQRGPNQYRYESPNSWETLQLLRFASLDEAEYPEVRRTYEYGGHADYFPVADMVIEEQDRPPILFSGAHNRLLYEITPPGVVSIAPHPRRLLINIDRHDDFQLGSTGYNPYDVHIGNWVSVGAVNGYWGRYAHMDADYEPIWLDERPRPALATIPVERALQVVPFYRFSTRYNFPVLADMVKALLDTTGSDPFIFSLDADGLASWFKPFDTEGRQVLETVLGQVLPRSNLELVHFTPSPAYCPHEEAKQVWDAFRQIWQEHYDINPSSVS